MDIYATYNFKLLIKYKIIVKIIDFNKKIKKEIYKK